MDDLASRIRSVPVNAALLVGGISNKSTLKELDEDNVDVLVGTVGAPLHITCVLLSVPFLLFGSHRLDVSFLQPSIVASYMKKGKINASRCKHFVVDEADELIATDAVQHIHAIYGRLVAANRGASKFDRLQVCFFSATLDTPEVRQLADAICHEPLWVNLRGGQGDSVFPDTVQDCVVNVSPAAFEIREFVRTDAVHRRGRLDAPASLNGLSEDEANSEKIKQLKFRAVLAVLDAFSMDQVLIFCRTNLDCDLMERHLKSQQAGGGEGLVDKYSCRVLAGMRSMQDRQKALEDFKGGDARILIATDVAARGIDIRELPFVINATLPSSSATYVHRCGRVGRADRVGLAVSLVASTKEKVWFCQPGKKPPCDDTRDYKNGGTTVNAQTFRIGPFSTSHLPFVCLQETAFGTTSLLCGRKSRDYVERMVSLHRR
jgi:ATP-dependent RNA helicase DDX1